MAMTNKRFSICKVLDDDNAAITTQHSKLPTIPNFYEDDADDNWK